MLGQQGRLAGRSLHQEVAVSQHARDTGAGEGRSPCQSFPGILPLQVGLRSQRHKGWDSHHRIRVSHKPIGDALEVPRL